MVGFVQFMRSQSGRAIRFVLGLVLIYWGFWGGGGLILGLIGFIPIYASIANVCFLAPFSGMTFRGMPKK